MLREYSDDYERDIPQATLVEAIERHRKALIELNLAKAGVVAAEAVVAWSKLRDLGIRPGDEIEIEYSDGVQRAILEEVVPCEYGPIKLRFVSTAGRKHKTIRHEDIDIIESMKKIAKAAKEKQPA